MVAQLLALSHNPNKSPNYINAASDAIDPAAGTGPSAGLGNMGLHPGLAGGGVVSTVERERFICTCADVVG